MLFHASIPAADTKRVSGVLAELWKGWSAPFPPFPGSHIAMAGDERGTEIEVCPLTQENLIGSVEVETGRNDHANGRSACHLAIASPLEEQHILAIAAREGWTARRCDRGGCFHVIEFWLENRFLVEVLTEEMQREYLGFMTPERWQDTFGGVEPAINRAT
jgi:hypothetical protein